jgi:hypothetical protein
MTLFHLRPALFSQSRYKRVDVAMGVWIGDMLWIYDDEEGGAEMMSVAGG